MMILYPKAELSPFPLLRRKFLSPQPSLNFPVFFGDKSNIEGRIKIVLPLDPNETVTFCDNRHVDWAAYAFSWARYTLFQ
jgi:hypothetical protein